MTLTLLWSNVDKPARTRIVDVLIAKGNRSYHRAAEAHAFGHAGRAARNFRKAVEWAAAVRRLGWRAEDLEARLIALARIIGGIEIEQPT